MIADIMRLPCPSILSFFVRLAGCFALLVAWFLAAASLQSDAPRSSAALSRIALPVLCILAAAAALALDIYISRREPVERNKSRVDDNAKI